MNAERLETALARERSLLSSLRVALRDTQELAAERLRRRNEVAQRLGRLDQELESVNAELREASELAGSDRLRQAARTRGSARRAALLAGSDELRAELRLVEGRAVLLPWQRDVAELKVARSERVTALHEVVLRDLRRREAESSLQDVRARAQEIAERLPGLATMTEAVTQLAETLWAPDGVMAESLRTDSALTETRKNITQLKSIIALTERRFEAVGHTGDITQWWPTTPAGFPRLAEVRSEIQQQEALIPEVQHQLIQFEQQRAHFREYESEVDKLLDEAGEAAEGGVPPEVRSSVWDLVHTGRELLDSLVEQYGRHAGRLVELVTISRNFLAEGEALRSFTYEKVLWARSVPGSIFPNAADSLQALLWVASPASWFPGLSQVGRAILGSPLGAILFVLTLGLLIWSRPRIASRLEVLAGRVADTGTDSFLASLEALGHTVLLALPVPLLLHVGGRVLQSSSDPFLVDAGEALGWVAAVSGLFELIRQWLRKDGFAEAHLGWASEVIRPIRWGLLGPQVLFLPLLFVALHLSAGMRLDTPEQLQAYNNSLGRIAFVLATGGLGLSLCGVFRPRHWRMAIHRRIALSAVPLISFSLLAPAVLAAFGFYVTGMLLAYQMLRTAWLGAGILALGGLLYRGLVVSRQRSAARFASLGAAEESKPAFHPSLGVSQKDVLTAEEQTRRLLRFVLVLLMGFGLFSIWYEAAPTLQILKRVQIWPSIALLEEAESPASQEGATRSGKAEDNGEGESGQSAPTPSSLVSAAPAAAAADGDSSGITIWHLLEALLAFFITAALVKNIPGLLELVLLHRTSVDRGARIAFSTLVRYAIMIVGTMVITGLLGITWNRAQWLVAAFTFGLGFGLQEIVANFVSGLILLLERPVRVGDAVRIGELQGRVTNTRIRATTIALFDRSEMIVPNKEFITKSLINWTLSDSKRRLEIPLRVSYGTSVEQVKRVLLEVARGHKDVLEDPPPQALLQEFGESGLRFELRAFVDFGQGIVAKDQLLVAIDKAFREEGIEFAVPKLAIQMPPQPGEK